MILFLDTSTPITKLWFGETLKEYETHRTLARDLLGLISSNIQKDLSRITALAVFKGPGSFTGLRIGITVANALADQLKIPIVGATGSNWRKEAKGRIENGENDQVVLPEYGKPANITRPKK